jgi:hypothetical protein
MMTRSMLPLRQTPYALDQVQKGNRIYSSKYILHIFYDDYTLCIFVVLEVSKKHLHLDNGEITIPHVDIYKFCPRSTRDAGWAFIKSNIRGVYHNLFSSGS